MHTNVCCAGIAGVAWETALFRRIRQEAVLLIRPLSPLQLCQPLLMCHLRLVNRIW